MTKNYYPQALLTILLSIFSAAAASESGPDALAIDFADESMLFADIPSVYAASKHEQKVTEAPASVSIVTADEISKFGYRTLGEILNSMPGIFNTNDRNYGYIGIRGFGRPGDYNTRILLLIDGHRANDNIYDSAPTGLSLGIEVDLIDRVELVRGPSSSLYGTSAFFGVVNVITKQGRDYKGVEVSAAAGSFNTREARLTYGNKLNNGVEVLLSTSFYDSDGDDRLYFKEFDAPATNNGIAENADDEQKESLFAKFSKDNIDLEAGYSSREKTIPTAAFGTEFNTTRTQTIDEYIFINMTYYQDLDKKSNLTGRLGYSQYDYWGDYDYLVINKDSSKGQWWTGELVLKNQINKHRLTSGIEYRDNIKQDQRNYDDDTPIFTYLDDERTSNNWGVFIQDEYPIQENLSLHIGVRHDDHDVFGGTTNPRVGLVYAIGEGGAAKLLYGEAFRAPNAYESYYNDDNSTQKAAIQLDPETIKTWELVFENYFTRHMLGTASVYHYTIDDLISLTTDPMDGLLVFNNIGEISASGIELSIENKWASGTEGHFSYAYQETEDKATNQILTNSPRSLAKASLITNIPGVSNKVFAGIEVNYIGERKTLASNKSDSAVITNLTLYGKQVTWGMNITASLYNLFDEKYSDPGSEEHTQDLIEQDGREFRIKLDYAF